MPIIENSTLVRAPRDVVFDALSDLRGELAWNPKVEIMEKITDGPVGLGTQFRAKWKLSQVLTAECVRFDRPNGWTYVNGGPIEVRLDADLADAPGGTVVRARFEPHPRGSLAHLMYPFFLVAIRREEKQNTAHYKAWIESGAPTTT
jgi:hypothetical protein